MWCGLFFFFQAEDGIRDLVRSRGLGDVYKRQSVFYPGGSVSVATKATPISNRGAERHWWGGLNSCCLLYTSDAADERSSVDLGGRRIIKQKQ